MRRPKIQILDQGYTIDRAFFRSKLETAARRIGLGGTVAIKLGGNDESRRLNATYLKKDVATDVLSFPIHQQLPEGYHAGDVFVCVTVAESQAESAGVCLKKELLTLMLHGLLHLAGYDHETDRGQMRRLQIDLMAELWTEADGGD